MAKMTLKKAHRLQSQLQEKARFRLEAAAVHKLKISDDVVKEQWEELNTKNVQAVKTALSALDLIYKIRELIKVANDRKMSLGSKQMSIHEIMTAKAKAEQIISTLSTFSTKEVKSNEKVIEQLQLHGQMVTKLDNQYSGSSMLSIPACLSPDSHNEFYAEYKNAKLIQQECVDQLGAFNNLIEIELSEEDIEFCKELDIM